MQFSVIVPVYNAGKTLRRCLNSLVPQLQGRAELILINDGSEDDSEQICLEYRELYPEIVYLYKENGGASEARNLGISVSTGEFISFVDSDDYVSSDYFDVLSSQLDADVLFFLEKTFQGDVITDTAYGFRPAKAADHYACIREFVQSRNGSPGNKRFRRSLINDHDIRFPTDLHIGEDFVFSLRYLLVTQSAAVSDHVLYYVDESNRHSVSRKYNSNVVTQAIANYNYCECAIRDSSLTNAQKDELLRLQYQYRYRTAFACVMELLKLDDHAYRKLRPKIRSVLQSFHVDNQESGPIHGKYGFMKLCVERRWTFIAYIVAKLKYWSKTRAGYAASEDE